MEDFKMVEFELGFECKVEGTEGKKGHFKKSKSKNTEK